MGSLHVNGLNVMKPPLYRRIYDIYVYTQTQRRSVSKPYTSFANSVHSSRNVNMCGRQKERSKCVNRLYQLIFVTLRKLPQLLFIQSHDYSGLYRCPHWGHLLSVCLCRIKYVETSTSLSLTKFLLSICNFSSKSGLRSSTV